MDQRSFKNTTILHKIEYIKMVIKPITAPAKPPAPFYISSINSIENIADNVISIQSCQRVGVSNQTYNKGQISEFN